MDGLPRDITAVGLTATGDLADASAFDAMSETRPPATQVARIEKTNLGQGLSLDKVLLDLYSGRVFGRWGPSVHGYGCRASGFSRGQRNLDVPSSQLALNLFVHHSAESLTVEVPRDEFEIFFTWRDDQIADVRVSR